MLLPFTTLVLQSSTLIFMIDCLSLGLEVPWLVFPASSSCRGLVALPERVARHGKFLGVPRLAFPASSSCRGLVS